MRARAAGAAIFAAALVLVAIAVVWTPGPRQDVVAVGVWLLVTAGVGAVLVGNVPRNPVGWLLAGVALLVGLQGALYAVAARSAAGAVFTATAWLSHWIAVPGFGLFAFIVLLFPTGRLPSPRWRWVAWTLGAGLVVMTAAIAVLPAPVGDLGVDNPLGWEAGEELLAAVANVAQALVAVGAVAALASLVIRVRHAEGTERQQLKWFLLSAGVLVASLAFAGAASGVLNELSFALALVGLTGVPVAIGVAILEYHLYDVDRVINRALVYGILTVVVVALYVASVSLLAVAFEEALGLAASLAATAVVAVVFQPLRARLQRLVDRLVYGQRRDPTGAITTLARQLHDAPDPTDVPQRLVSTVAAALKLPYVAVELDHGDGHLSSVSQGSRPPAVEDLPIVWQEERLGRLVFGGDERLRPEDRDLLHYLTQQAAPALAAVRLTGALERSRHELIVAREEERRRLRSDLHDGLGPQLAGLAMGLDAIGNLLDTDRAAAREVVTRMRDRSREAIDTVRAVSRGLRPPVLDDLGLAGAVREHATMLAGSGVSVSISAPDALDDLPAAVEVAAFHICLEAVTNAARHAGAARIDVLLRRDGADLLLEVADDGRGMPEDAQARRPTGIGLASMHERAAELGGDLVVSRRDGGGTTVRARLPASPS